METLGVDSDRSWPAKVANERVYVAVGRDVAESKLTLQWAMESFGDDCDGFRILYVHYPTKTNPAGRQFDSSMSSEEIERENVNKLLDEYVNMCRRAKVPVEKRWIEERDIRKGIVELIELHAITKLVMGAAADKYYTQEMNESGEIKSTKARYVDRHAYPSCSIWFICNGYLIYFREGDLSMVDMDVGSSWISAQYTVENKPSNPEGPSSSEADDDQPLVRHVRGEGSRHTSQPSLSSSFDSGSEYALLNGLGGYSHDEFDEQLDKAMEEAANAKREVVEELIRRQKAEKNVIEANRKVKVYETLYYKEHQRRKELEANQRVLQVELENALKVNEEEREELQVQLENALKVNEELLTNQSGESMASSSHSHLQQQQTLMEFSFFEIQEATDSFNPELKMEEGDYGSLYKGSLHYTPVSIKMLQSPAHYHKEVVVNRLRHPNLINLIGICPDACALIYEHLPNGNLEDRLSNTSAPLLWKKRIAICTEICAALIFLHSSNPHQTIHGDLKPRNVLLDGNLVSKLKDFGIHNQIDVTVETDVFSFGNILMRLLTGKSDPNLAIEVQDALIGGNLDTILDSTAGEWPFVEATQLAHLALSCCDMDQGNLPDLRSEVWSVLESVRVSCEEEALLPNYSNQSPPDQPPSHFVCPIQHDVMEDPVVAADGFSYESVAIQEWFDNGHDTSPMTNLHLPHSNLIPNQTLRSVIQEWKENQ